MGGGGPVISKRDIIIAFVIGLTVCAAMEVALTALVNTFTALMVIAQ